MKQRITRCIAMILVIVVTCSYGVMAVGANTPTFSDVPETFWAYEQIERAYDAGVMAGTYYNEQTGERRFSPEGELTIAQWVVILTRAFYASEVDASTVTGTWYAKNDAVAKAHNLYNKMGTVVMDSPCTRAQMALIIYNVMVDKGADMPSQAELQATKAKIPDINKNSFVYHDAIATCYYLGLLVGTDNAGSFAGNHALNRAQSAIVWARTNDAILSLVDPDKPDVPDPDGGWPDATLANGKPITEENVLEIIEGFKTEYPQNSTYDPNTPYYSFGFNVNGTECAKLALILSDKIFGRLPARSHTDFETVRPGDLIFTDTNGRTHWYLVTSPIDEDGYWTGVGGGPEGIVSWNEYGSVDSANNAHNNGVTAVVYTRYP